MRTIKLLRRELGLSVGHVGALTGAVRYVIYCIDRHLRILRSAATFCFVLGETSQDIVELHIRVHIGVFKCLRCCCILTLRFIAAAAVLTMQQSRCASSSWPVWRCSA
jgi:hypothetical protein